MFYVDINAETQDNEMENEVTSKNGTGPRSADVLRCLDAVERLPSRSGTLKSNADDYDTPPESPSPEVEVEVVFDKESSVEPARISDKPPIPPPRLRRAAKANKIQDLKLKKNPSTESQGPASITDDSVHQNDILFNENCIVPPASQTQNNLKGYLSMLVISAKGLRQMMKVRWFVYDKVSGKLRYFKSDDEAEMIGEIDIMSATFCYDVENDKNGEFTVCTKSGEHVLSAGTSEKRMYWLQQLQKARREYSQAGVLHRTSAVGLLKERTPDEDTASIPKESSPFKDIMQTLERPIDYASPPRSADYVKKASFFQSLTKNKTHFRIPRSASMRTPSPPPGPMDQRSPPPSKPISSPSTSFTALTKIRKSLREKKPLSPSHGPWPQKRFDVEHHKEVVALRDDLQAAKDDAAASKEVIAVLQKQIEQLQKEKDTLSELHRPELDDGQLLEILRAKDNQIVELESDNRENRKTVDLQESQIQKQREEVQTYRHLLEVKDESIVRLTNQLHEMELESVVAAAVDSPRQPHKLGNTTNGLSFDSDKFEFREFVEVGTQMSSEADAEKENLQDTVVAYEMQNKFLNKEVLELNQLRQQAIDREQKLLIEASDWEAKFYQIQSKYLLLLNELHNPQVAVSASRQEMVGQLLKDIVEAAERPTLTSNSAAYDRFGFRIDISEDDSVVDKAERLRKQAEDNSEPTQIDNPELETRWEDAISALNGKHPFTITSDIKNLLRMGIPISQRGSVWKAIVDHKLMRCHYERFQSDYYNKLLSNYNPGRNLTPAAKQIELDLLRTLPNNKHYDGPHADGIAKLRRVLLAYSVHNPDVEYCQGFNRIAAIALLFMHEEDAFWCLVYIVEHLMPPEYYSRDKQLIGAQVDQEVMKELLAEKVPRLFTHFTNHGVDAALFSLNWFLCVFVDSVPVKTYLHIWDSFLFEGSKVLFRYAIAIFKHLEENLLRQTDYMSIFNTLRKEVENLYDIKKITQTAFHELNPFPMRTITNKREHHYKLLEAQKKELDNIRQNYRKNSLARSPNIASKDVVMNPIVSDED